MEITESHWMAFRLVEQEEHSPFQASEKMGIDRREVLTLLTELKSIEPSLFPIESEKANMRRQLRAMPVDKQPEMLQYDPAMDDGSIKRKF